MSKSNNKSSQSKSAQSKFIQPKSPLPNIKSKTPDKKRMTHVNSPQSKMSDVNLPSNSADARRNQSGARSSKNAGPSNKSSQSTSARTRRGR